MILCKCIANDWLIARSFGMRSTNFMIRFVVTQNFINIYPLFNKIQCFRLTCSSTGHPRSSSSFCEDSPSPSNAEQSTMRAPILPGSTALIPAIDDKIYNVNVVQWRYVSVYVPSVVGWPTSTDPAPSFPPNSSQTRTRGDFLYDSRAMCCIRPCLRAS